MRSGKEDRESIKTLHGTSLGSGSVFAWKHEPTRIQLPSNPPPSSRNSLSHSSKQTNPYSSNPNHKKAQVRTSKIIGNPTARQTIDSSNGENLGRATKRQKVAHNPGPTTATSISARSIPNIRQSRPPLAPESIGDVDEIDASGDERKRQDSSYRNRLSSDELNIPSVVLSNVDILASKYKFPVEGNLAPDGDATRWVEGLYGGSKEESPEPDSDSIRAFTPEPESGFVKHQVAKYDSAGPKLNLRKVGSKANAGSKANKMQPKVRNAQRVKDSTNLTNGVPKLSLQPNRDPIASSSTSYRFTNQRKGKSNKEELQLPIKEAYLGSHFHPDLVGRSVFLFWNTEGLAVKVNDVVTFARTGIQLEGWQCTYCMDPPLIQLKGPGYSRDSLITIKFHPEKSSSKSGDFEKLLGYFRKRNVPLSRANGSQLWEVAERFKRDQDLEDVDPNGRMKVLQSIEEKRKNIPFEPTRNPNPQRASVASASSRPESSEGKNSAAAPRRIRPDVTNQTVGTSNLRRSARTVAPQMVSPPSDQDEVILVYPQGAPGAVNLTNGDLARLEPGEYLNDTLIEFGLKHWLSQLEMHNPELASQVHVFNSFFYKKLVHKKDPEQAFESLRKWTSKFDIFEKKYIIVPINENFHWYLAIIYEPEHVLTPEVPSPRKDTRSSIKHDMLVPTTAALPESRPSTSTDENNCDTTTSSIKHDAAVVRISDMSPAKKLPTPVDNSDDDISCHIDDVDNRLAPSPVVEGVVAGSDDDDDALSYASDKADIATNANPADETSAVTDVDLDSCPSDKAMVVDDIDDIDTMELDQDGDRSTTLNMGVIPPTKFYGSNKAKGKQKMISKTNKDEGDDVVVLDPAPKTYIFTLDSLGTRHPRATSRLATYLKLEARDKKGIPNASLAQGKMAFVPTQPNFCDCGVYLIHFVKTFMTNPKRYWHSILNQKSTKTINKERQDEWHDERVASMREGLAKEIRVLSRLWKQDRRLKDADANDKVNPVESSDSDVVVNTSPKRVRAKRLRG